MNVEKDLQKVVDLVVEHLKIENFKDDIYIAGGAIRDLVNGKVPKDYDFYITNVTSAQAIKILVGKKYIFNVNGNLDTYINGYRINMVFTPEFCLKPQDLLKQFNFFQNMNFYHKGVLSLDGFVKSKELIVNPNSAYPLGTLMKIPRMVELGYTIDSAEMAFLLSKVLPLGIKSKEQFIANCPNMSGAFSINLPTEQELFNSSEIGQALS